MDPITIAAVVVLVIFIALRMFYKTAKFFFKIAFVIVIAIILWRLLSQAG